METKLIRKDNESGNAVSYYFELPTKNYEWLAGQYTSIMFQSSEDTHDNKHWFTIASAPETRQIQITTRSNTASFFKNKLESLQGGSSVYIANAEGDFVWQESQLPKLFIAGGIGITPFHSILESRCLNKLDSQVHLVYVNRDDEYVFKDNLETYQDAMPGLKISYLKGQITKDLITNVEPNLYNSLVYLSGPEPMVESVGSELLSTGLKDSQLKRDWFPGYDSTNF